MGVDTKLDAIKYVDLETYKNRLKRTFFKNGKIRQIATVNRHLITLHHFFQKGAEWDLIGESPFARGKSLKEKENNTRLRYLDQNEIERVLDNCIKEYVKDVIITALNTGMRRQEVLSLTWNQIKKDGLIYLTKTKTNEARQIPINDDLAELFRNIRHRVQLRSEYVFCDSYGKPFKEIRKAFKATLERAGIEDFRFHDLRHTFASHFIMRGGSIKELQEILGHKNITMTMRYAHLSQEHKKKAVNRLNGLTNTPKKNTTCHKMSQNREMKIVTH